VSIFFRTLAQRFAVTEPVYEVFARKSRGEPLRHIGFINASGDELARVYAWKTYDEQNWEEMCVVPRAAIVPVNAGSSQFVTRMGQNGASELVHTRGTGSYGGADVATREAR
jgi:1,2-phenylacetyl-CoA epoxidase PaaB subunit